MPLCTGATCLYSEVAFKYSCMTFITALCNTDSIVQRLSDGRGILTDSKGTLTDGKGRLTDGASRLTAQDPIVVYLQE